MSKKLLKILIFLLLFSGVVNTSLAQIFDDSGEMVSQFDSFLGESGYEAEVKIEDVVASIIQYLLSFLGVIFVVLVIYAGFLWMTASGDEEQITKAKDIMKSAVIGIIIVLASYIVTTTILDKLGTATGTGET